MKKGSTIAVLVLSCDKYADAWPPFFELFRKFWPDCSFPIYLGSNELNTEFPGVKVIQSGKAIDWSTDAKNILAQIEEKYVIVLLEDYFLNRPVDTIWLNECLQFAEKSDAAFMRIASFRKDHYPMYAFDVSQENPRFGLTKNNVPFRINLQAGIWNKEDLLKLIQEGESAWEFEVNGSKRSNSTERLCFGITESSEMNILVGPIPYLCTAITKGTWMREAINLCNRENVSIDCTKRPVESKLAFAKRKLYHSFSYPNRKYIDYISKKLSKGKN